MLIVSCYALPLVASQTRQNLQKKLALHRAQSRQQTLILKVASSEMKDGGLTLEQTKNLIKTAMIDKNADMRAMDFGLSLRHIVQLYENRSKERAGLDGTRLSFGVKNALRGALTFLHLLKNEKKISKEAFLTTYIDILKSKTNNELSDLANDLSKGMVTNGTVGATFYIFHSFLRDNLKLKIGTIAKFFDAMFRAVTAIKDSTIDIINQTSIHYILANCSSDPVDAITGFCEEHGTSALHKPDFHGFYPIHYAAFYNYPKVIDYLFKNGCSANVCDEAGLLPFVLGSDKQVVQMLKDKITAEQLLTDKTTAEQYDGSMAKCTAVKTGNIETLQTVLNLEKRLKLSSVGTSAALKLAKSKLARMKKKKNEKQIKVYKSIIQLLEPEDTTKKQELTETKEKKEKNKLTKTVQQVCTLQKFDSTCQLTSSAKISCNGKQKKKKKKKKNTQDIDAKVHQIAETLIVDTTKELQNTQQLQEKKLNEQADAVARKFAAKRIFDAVRLFNQNRRKHLAVKQNADITRERVTQQKLHSAFSGWRKLMQKKLIKSQAAQKAVMFLATKQKQQNKQQLTDALTQWHSYAKVEKNAEEKRIKEKAIKIRELQKIKDIEDQLRFSQELQHGLQVQVWHGYTEFDPGAHEWCIQHWMLEKNKIDKALASDVTVLNKLCAVCLANKQGPYAQSNTSLSK